MSFRSGFLTGRSISRRTGAAAGFGGYAVSIAHMTRPALSVIKPVSTGVVVSTSYDNDLGSGDRAATIAVTESRSDLILGAHPEKQYLVNGAGGGAGGGGNIAYWSNGINALDEWLKFNLGSNKVIDEVKYYQADTTTHGTYKWQGSTDDSDWTDIGGSFALGGVGASGGGTAQTITTLNGNTTAYRYYRMFGLSGTNSWSPWVYEFEFKVEA